MSLNPRNTYLAIASIVGAYWFAGFYPFELDPPSRYQNGAALGTDGLTFSSAGIARTEVAPPWLAEAIERERLTIAVEACPLRPEQNGPARIVAISRDPHHQNLVIGQEAQDLVVRLRRPSSDLSGNPPFLLRSVFREPGCRDISVSIAQAELVVRALGVEELRTTLEPGALGTWDPSYRLVVGNEQTGDRPWLGRIGRLAAGDPSHPIDYLGSDALRIPARVWSIPKRFQELAVAGPWATGAADAFRNLGGFLLLPLLISVATAGRASTVTLVLAAFAVSLSVETGQILFARWPSLADVAIDVTGAMLGIALLRLRPREWTRWIRGLSRGEV